MPGKKPKEEEVEKDPSRVLFLSLNMILLAFFILLVALSQPNESKEAELAIELRKAFQTFGGAHLGLGQALEERGFTPDDSLQESKRNVEAFLGELSRFLVENENAQVFSYRITNEGLSMHLSEDFIFPEGSGQILKRSEELFNALYSLIYRTTNPVRIEGHTDDQEVRTNRIHDNFELSAARAMAVYRLFTESGTLPPARFTVAGYGANRPISNNLTARGRRSNRRVTVTLVGALQQAGETPVKR